MDILTDLKVRFSTIDAFAPYKNEGEYINDLMSLVSAYLYLGVTIKGKDATQRNNFLLGTTFSPAEALRYLENYPNKSYPLDGEVIDVVSSAYSTIEEKINITENSESYRFIRLRNKLALDDFSYFCVVVSYGAATDSGFQAAFGMMNLDGVYRYPTLPLLKALYSLIYPQPKSQDYNFTDKGTLPSLLFEGSEHLSDRELKLSEHAVVYLSGRDYSINQMSFTLIDGSNEEELRFCDKQMQGMEEIISPYVPSIMGSIVALCGISGSGRKLTLHKIAKKYDMPFLLIPFDINYQISEILLFCILEGYSLCFEDVDYEDIASIAKLEQILRILAPFKPVVVFLAGDLRRGFAANGYLFRRIDYKRLKQSEALMHWEKFAENYPVSEDVSFSELTATYNLTPGQMLIALEQAMCEGGAEGVNDKNLRSAILQSNIGKLSELADKVESFYTWDDLVLSDSSKQSLQNVCDRIKYKYKVEQEWGFKKKRAYGNGISILLYGPPGTGKTMSAQVLSRELSLPLYRINISQITSKYIGETSKNLNMIFEEANKTNSILFFDEADALFTKRTEVSNSNDRHANSEVSYLLQKIEEFQGISILATNLASNFDEAFRRRISYLVNIHMPSPEERLNMWKSNFPDSAPVGEIDFELLATGLDFSGSVIKSTVTQAAYFAAAANEVIEMKHIVKAVKTELHKLGKMLPNIIDMYDEEKM